MLFVKLTDGSVANIKMYMRNNKNLANGSLNTYITGKGAVISNNSPYIKINGEGSGSGSRAKLSSTITLPAGTYTISYQIISGVYPKETTTTPSHNILSVYKLNANGGLTWNTLSAGVYIYYLMYASNYYDHKDSKTFTLTETTSFVIVLENGIGNLKDFVIAYQIVEGEVADFNFVESNTIQDLNMYVKKTKNVYDGTMAAKTLNGLTAIATSNRIHITGTGSQDSRGILTSPKVFKAGTYTLLLRREQGTVTPATGRTHHLMYFYKYNENSIYPTWTNYGDIIWYTDQKTNKQTFTLTEDTLIGLCTYQMLNEIYDDCVFSYNVIEGDGAGIDLTTYIFEPYNEAKQI